jgi:hypothetical protein
MYCHQPSSVFLTLSTWIMDVACIAQSTTWSKLLEFGTNSLHRIFASYDSHLWSLTLHCLLWKKVLIVIMSWTMWTTCHHHCIIIWRCSTDLPSCSRLNYRWHTLVICPSSLGFQFSAHRLVFPQWNYAIELLQRASMSECHSTATYVDTSAKMSATDESPGNNSSYIRVLLVLCNTSHWHALALHMPANRCVYTCMILVTLI